MRKPQPQQRSIDLVRIAGIDIAVDFSWVVIFLLVLWSLTAGYFPQAYPGQPWFTYFVGGLAATLLFFVSVLVHELSHALVANRLGEHVRRITLFLFGGMAHLSNEPRSPAVEFKIAVVGPLTSFALGGLYWGLSLLVGGAAPLWREVFHYLGFINAALAIFNLLPGFPLDGGRLLRAYFWSRSGDLRDATGRAADWGGGIAIGLMFLGAVQIFSGALVGGLWLIFIGVFLRGAARASYYGLVVEQALEKARVRDFMVRDPVTVPPDMSVSDAVEQYFIGRGYGGFPVGRDGQVEGLLSLPMVQQCPPEERDVRRVREIMLPVGEQVSIGPEATVSEALEKMSSAGIGRLLVLAHGRLLGLITRSRIARFVQVKTQLEGGMQLQTEV